jgi:hypothetical protein
VRAARCGIETPGHCGKIASGQRQHVLLGVVGGIDWSFGRKRGLGL